MVSENERQISIALGVLQNVLRRFVEKELRSQYGERWLEHARLSLTEFSSPRIREPNLDVQALIRIANDRRHKALFGSLPPVSRAYLQELREVRNRFAHQHRFEDRDLSRALETMTLFLHSIKAPEEAEIASMRKRREEQGVIAPNHGFSGKAAREAEPSVPATGGPDLQRGVRLFR